MNILKPANFEEFAALAAEGNTVAVERTVPADLLTPLAAYIRLSKNSDYSFLLESVEGGEHLARYSFLGAEPLLVIRSHAGETKVATTSGEKAMPGITAIDYLREHFRGRQLARPGDYTPMAGGAVGYLGYGAAQWFDPAMQALPSEDNDAMFMIFRTIVAFDHARQELKITTVAMTDEAGEGEEREAKLKDLYLEAVARTEKIVTGLRDAVELRTPVKKVEEGGEFESNFEPEAFKQAVTDCKELIAAGECFQIVPSQRFSRKTGAGPVAIYRALRMTNPSPYMFLLRCGEESLIGASPEMLVRCTGRQLEYRPIAGTRPRSNDREEDARLAKEMLADEKECAEHVMLVDLGRNDLGRVAEYGSVKPTRLMKVEKYSHVQHMVTELEATLREGLDRFDALGACFPAGTVTGAPKIRAMQAIAELEKTPRGVYSGSVIYADYAANLDSCIAIRTIELRRGVAKVQAGAGIVADSVPESELQETINKARALQQAVAIAEAGF
jgi:anthranilate synthase component 1